MAEILGKVTGSFEAPRGPDALLRVRVPPQWVAEAAVIEIELPRNLLCGACDGGGCDACARSGAITLRGRKEPPELLEVTLPSGAPESGQGRGLVLRIPERGGFAPAGSGVGRGVLLLRVEVGETPGAGVRRLTPEELADPRRPSLAPPAASAPTGRRVSPVVGVVALVAALFAVGLLLGLLGGR